MIFLNGFPNSCITISRSIFCSNNDLCGYGFYNSKNLNCLGALCFLRLKDFKLDLVFIQVLRVVQLLGWP